MDQITQKVPDPQGMIARIRSKMSPECSVMKSPFCDYIIAMRMQGVSYQQIEKFLIGQGPEHRIPAPTLWRNFTATKLEIELPYAEELAEKWGGSIDLDLARELARQILTQRQRIDKMVRQEEKKREDSPGYVDKRIRAEMETINNLIRTLHGMMKDPMEAAEERRRAADTMKPDLPGFELNEDAASVLTEMILGDELKLDLGGQFGAPGKPN